MRIHPFIAGAALLLAGVIALGATLIVERHERRNHRPAPAPEAPEPEPLPPPKPLAVAHAPSRATPPAPEAPPGGALHVRVRGPHGIVLNGVEVSAVLRRDDLEETSSLEESEDDGGTFSTDDLQPGRYEVRVDAPGMRTAVLQDVATDRELVAVSLARAAVLLGAVGARHEGNGCEGVHVTATVPESEEEYQPRLDTDVDADHCTFAIEDLPEAGPLVVVARGPDWRERVLVTLPAAGDPVPVCFRPPCETSPGSLAVYIADANGHEAEETELEWSREEETEGELGQTTAGGLTYVHGRRPGQVLHLRAGGTASTVVIRPGINEVVLTLPPADDT